MLMLAVVALLPTCLLGLLALTSHLEEWLARPDQSATTTGELLRAPTNRDSGAARDEPMAKGI
jgi:hypothetical protein